MALTEQDLSEAKIGFKLNDYQVEMNFPCYQNNSWLSRQSAARGV